MEEIGLVWETDAWGCFDIEWNLNLTRLIDSLSTWCKDSGIKRYGVSHTQIALSLTFMDAKDAMMFKLRWHHA